MIHKWKHFINLKALYQGNALFNKTFTFSKDTAERQCFMVKGAQAERHIWSWVPQPPCKRHVPGPCAPALKGPVSAWKPLWWAMDNACKTASAVTSTLVSTWRSNFTNGYRLTPNHTFFPHDTTSLSWLCWIIWLVQNTVRWSFHAAFIDLRLEKLAPSNVRVRTWGRAEGCQGQGQGQRLLLAGRLAHTGEKVHCLWPGREGKVSQASSRLSLESQRTPKPASGAGTPNMLPAYSQKRGQMICNMHRLLFVICLNQGQRTHKAMLSKCSCVSKSGCRKKLGDVQCKTHPPVVSYCSLSRTIYLWWSSLTTWDVHWNKCLWQPYANCAKRLGVLDGTQEQNFPPWPHTLN